MEIALDQIKEAINLIDMLSQSHEEKITALCVICVAAMRNREDEVSRSVVAVIKDIQSMSFSLMNDINYEAERLGANFVQEEGRTCSSCVALDDGVCMNFGHTPSPLDSCEEHLTPEQDASRETERERIRSELAKGNSSLDALKLALARAVPSILSPGWAMIPDKDFETIKQALAAPEREAIAAIINAPAAPSCTRSHPHENMDAMCELRTEIARLTNENARLKERLAPVQTVVGKTPKIDRKTSEIRMDTGFDGDGQQVPVSYTAGHCKEKAKPGGCRLHNLSCGYPTCDRITVTTQPAAQKGGAA